SRINETRMRALGFPTLRYRLAAYVISAMLCGVAGLLYANLTQFAAPSYMSWAMSGELIVMVVLGGMGSVMGPLYGAAALLLTEEVLKGITEHWMIILGPAIVAVAVASRHGIAGLVSGAPDSVSRRPAFDGASADTDATDSINTEGKHPAAVATKASPTRLTVRGLVKRYGGLLATDDVELQLETGRIHAVIGPNGAGKSTLIGQLSGEIVPDAGTIELNGQDITRLPVHVRSL